MTGLPLIPTLNPELGVLESMNANLNNIHSTLANLGLQGGTGNGPWMQWTQDNLDPVLNQKIVLLSGVKYAKIECIIYNYHDDTQYTSEIDVSYQGSEQIVYGPTFNTLKVGINGALELYLVETQDDLQQGLYRITMAILPDPHPGGYSVSVPGADGADGQDGNTPYIQAGNWWINGIDTGVNATGPAGEDGVVTVTAWTGVTFAAGYTNHSTNHAVKCRLFDDVVQLRGLVKPTSGFVGQNDVLFTLPSGYRLPGANPEQLILTVLGGSTDYSGRIIIKSNGEISYSSAQTDCTWVSLYNIWFSITA